MLRASALAASLMVFAAAAHAQADDYRCVVERVVIASPDTDVQKFNDAYIGKEFTVERRTGLMVGALKNSFSTEPQVIDMGSPGNAYKVVTTMRIEQGAGAGSNAYLLTINEYEDGPKKSFLFAHNGVAYFGTCVHF